MLWSPREHSILSSVVSISAPSHLAHWQPKNTSIWVWATIFPKNIEVWLKLWENGGREAFQWQKNIVQNENLLICLVEILFSYSHLAFLQLFNVHHHLFMATTSISKWLLHHLKSLSRLFFRPLLAIWLTDLTLFCKKVLEEK